MEPLVSVIIPARNAGKWLAASLASATGQTWRHLEIIVIDDGSSDDTGAIAAACPDNRVRSVKQEQNGAAAARNRGIRESRGTLIQFLDADDILGRDKLSLQIAALHASPLGSVASCSWARFSDTTEAATPVAEPVWEISDPLDWLVQSFSGGGMMQPACWLVPRDIVDAAGPWDESLSLHDDGEYFTRVLVRAARNVFVGGATVFYRSVPDSLSNRRSRAAAESGYMVCEGRARSLLSMRDDEAARRGVATQYAQFAYEFWESAPDLSRKALQAVKSLRVAPAEVVGGPAFRAAQKVLGFERALRLRTLKASE